MHDIANCPLCDGRDLVPGYREDGRPYIMCIPCNLVMTGPDLVINTAATRFQAADSLIRNWNTRNGIQRNGAATIGASEESHREDYKGRRDKRSRRHSND